MEESFMDPLYLKYLGLGILLIIISASTKIEKEVEPIFENNFFRLFFMILITLASQYDKGYGILLASIYIIFIDRGIVPQQFESFRNSGPDGIYKLNSKKPNEIFGDHRDDGGHDRDDGVHDRDDYDVDDGDHDRGDVGDYNRETDVDEGFKGRKKKHKHKYGKKKERSDDGKNKHNGIMKGKNNGSLADDNHDVSLGNDKNLEENMSNKIIEGFDQYSELENFDININQNDNMEIYNSFINNEFNKYKNIF